MAFTEKELQESIDELNQLESEIAQIDAEYQRLEKEMSEMKGAPAIDNKQIDSLVAEAMDRAKAEGEARARAYREKHGTVEPTPTLRRPGRRGMMI